MYIDEDSTYYNMNNIQHIDYIVYIYSDDDNTHNTKFQWIKAIYVFHLNLFYGYFDQKIASQHVLLYNSLGPSS